MKVVSNFNITVALLLYFGLVLVMFCGGGEQQCVDVRELCVV